MTAEFLWKLCFQADKRNSEKISFCICCFSSATSQNSQYTEVAYLGWYILDIFFERWYIMLPFKLN